MGSYSSHGVAIDPRYLSEELLESLQSLENYPVLNEDALGELELELQGEAWENYLRSDFSRALERLLCDLLSAHYEDGDEDRAEQSVENLSEEQLWELFSRTADENGIYWENQHNDCWIDSDRVAQSLSEDQLLSLLLPEESVSR
jgi:hypothetical protein